MVEGYSGPVASTPPITGTTVVVPLSVDLVPIVSIISPRTDTVGTSYPLGKEVERWRKSAYPRTLASPTGPTSSPKVANNKSATDVTHITVLHIHGLPPGSPVPGSPILTWLCDCPAFHTVTVLLSPRHVTDWSAPILIGH